MKVNEPRRQKLERRNCWQQVKHGKPSAVPHCGVIIPLTESNLSCLLDDQLVVIGFSTSSLISVCVYTYFESQVDNSPSLFFCYSGYTGKSCTEDVDECQDSPCQNGATCINLRGRFYCECPAGYSGDICEQDPCSTSNSCLHNATCVSRPGGITCLCPPRFTGVDCGKGWCDTPLVFVKEFALLCFG